MRVRRPSKIGQLQRVIMRQHDILRLQITMNDIVHVTVVQCIGHLVCVFGGACRRKSAAGRILQMFVQLTLRRQFQGQENFLLVMEPCVETQYIRVPTGQHKLNQDYYRKTEKN